MQLKMASPEQKVRAHGGTLSLCYAASNRCIGDSTAANDGSRRESTAEVTDADAADAGDSDPPTLKEFFLQTKTRRTAVSGASQSLQTRSGYDYTMEA